MPLPIALLALSLVPSSVAARQLGTPLVREDAIGDPNAWALGGNFAPRLEASGQALRATIENTDSPWLSQVARPSVAAVKEGDAVQVTLRARGSAGVTAYAVFERASAPNEKIVYAPISLGSDWRDFRVARRAAFPLAAGEANFKLFFSGKGSVEIGGVTVRNLGAVDPQPALDRVGPSTRDRSPETLALARKNIERIRKGNIALNVRGSDGRPLRNALVRVKLVRHKFRFGTAVPAERILEKSATGEKFREILAREFNTVTFENDLKWQENSPKPLEVAQLAMPWLKARGFEVRGHNLFWPAPQYMPSALRAAPTAAKWPLIAAHIRDYATRMKGQVYAWDVVNEAVDNVGIFEEIGWNRFGDAYKAARAADPNVKLAYNDYGMTSAATRAKAIARIALLRSQGAPIDLFGDQAHYGAPMPSNKTIYDGWTELAKGTGLPLEVTEFDYGTFDDAEYKSVLSDVLTMAFGNPAMQGFIVWGFWEGSHWRSAEGGHLVRNDFTYRPVMEEWARLTRKEWTTDATARTDVNGNLNVRAFYGTLEVSSGGRVGRVEHGRDGGRATVNLRGPVRRSAARLPAPSGRG